MSTKPTLRDLVAQIPGIDPRLVASVLQRDSNPPQCIVHVRHIDPHQPLATASWAPFCKAIGDVAAYAPPVSALWFHRAQLSDAQLEDVAKWIPALSKSGLQFLGLDDLALNEPSRYAWLQTVFPQLALVPHVSLRFNALGDAAAALFPIWKGPTCLIGTLDLSGNLLSPEACSAILRHATFALPKLKKLLFTLPASHSGWAVTPELTAAVTHATKGQLVPTDAWAKYRRSRYEVALGLAEAAKLDAFLQRLDDTKAGKKMKKGEELSEAELAASEWEKGVVAKDDGSGMQVPPHAALSHIEFTPVVIQ
jgi:hypothetical protein